MTRLDKIAVLNNRPKLRADINLFACDDAELDKIMSISNNEQKSIPRSADDWIYLDNLAKKQAKPEPIGEWVNPEKFVNGDHLFKK